MNRERIAVLFEVSELPIHKIDQLCEKFDTGIEIIEPKTYLDLNEKRIATRIMMPVMVIAREK